MKFNLNKYIYISAKFFIFFIAIISMRSTILNAEDSYLNELEIDSSTKFDKSSSELPSNPFEIVEMLRRANSMNEATKPSIAIDDALELFNKIEEKENL
ncbi:conserved hypothetical protein [Prochlorococcus marinus str. MIT 9515]|uniref:Uncharacterized protein n=2 Tax=Prochlorococcus marinus TaxID=1219 RepID=A2BVE7_PROM5|nr:conserved hypothetical protein [Prochlorococcus marinus str. MIT 9515]